MVHKKTDLTQNIFHDDLQVAATSTFIDVRLENM